MANWYSRAVFFVTDLETASDFTQVFWVSKKHGAMKKTEKKLSLK